MKYSDYSLKHLTERFEGCRLTAYQDQGGVWTVGYGHTGPHVVDGFTITQELAETLLVHDMLRAEDCINRKVTVPLTQCEFDALVDFTFNVGCEALTDSTLLRDLNAGNYQEAANQFERWDKVKGVTIAGLLRRREAEASIFKS